MIENVGLGLIAGAVWAGIGYAVAKYKEKEGFEPKNFLTAVVIGVALSIVATVAGLDMKTVENYTTVQLFTIIVDKAVGAFQKGEKK